MNKSAITLAFFLTMLAFAVNSFADSTTTPPVHESHPNYNSDPGSNRPMSADSTSSNAVSSAIVGVASKFLSGTSNGSKLYPEKLVMGRCDVESLGTKIPCTGVMVQLKRFKTGELLSQVRADGSGYFWFQGRPGEEYELDIKGSQYDITFAGIPPYRIGTNEQITLTPIKKVK